eukprot:Clim_evm95s150 gene=Clim_evmTU95s150
MTRNFKCTASPLIPKHALVLGAGVSGLAAAAELKKSGARVTVLEASDRIGGRMVSAHLNALDLEHQLNREPINVELGANYIHGLHGNPATDLTLKAKAAFSKMPEEVTLFVAKADNTPCGPINNELYARAEQIFEEAEEAVWETGIACKQQKRCDMSYGRILRQKIEEIVAREEEHELLEASTATITAEPTSPELPSSQPPKMMSADPAFKELIKWFCRTRVLYEAEELDRLELNFVAGDETPFPGGHQFVHGGYSKILDVIAADLAPSEILFGVTVRSVSYGSSGATVTDTTGRTYSADFVVVALPVTALSQPWSDNGVTFDPALPPKFTSCLGHSVFGTLDKIIVRYDRPFWQPRIDEMSIRQSRRHPVPQSPSTPSWPVAADFCGSPAPNDGAPPCPSPKTPGTATISEASCSSVPEKGEGLAFGVMGGISPWIVNMFPMTGHSILCGFVGGDEALAMEQMGDEEILERFDADIKKAFCLSAEEANSVHMVSYYITRWASDPLFRGSYSSLSPGSSFDHYDIINRPLRDSAGLDRVKFVGEWCSKAHVGTVHGAYITGVEGARSLALCHGLSNNAAEDVSSTSQEEPMDT